MNGPLQKLVSSKFFTLAQDLLQNPEGLKFKLHSVSEKMKLKNVKSVLGEHLTDLKTFIRMIRAWSSKEYTEVSKQSIIWAMTAVIYFLTPTDLVPDFILGIGFIDDIAVISWVISKIQVDLTKFSEWEISKKEARTQQGA